MASASEKVCVMKGPVKPVPVIEDGMVLRAATIGVRRALRIHKALGNPIAAERDGKVVLIPPEDIQIDDLPEPSDKPAEKPEHEFRKRRPSSARARTRRS